LELHPRLNPGKILLPQFFVRNVGDGVTAVVCRHIANASHRFRLVHKALLDRLVLLALWAHPEILVCEANRDLQGFHLTIAHPQTHRAFSVPQGHLVDLAKMDLLASLA